jgi:DNA polymerase-3 subunit epsilon
VGRYRLQTLADAFDLAHRPTHRTVSDVLATLDLLHYLCGISAA